MLRLAINLSGGRNNLRHRRGLCITRAAYRSASQTAGRTCLSSSWRRRQSSSSPPIVTPKTAPNHFNLQMLAQFDRAPQSLSLCIAETLSTLRGYFGESFSEDANFNDFSPIYCRGLLIHVGCAHQCRGSTRGTG